MLISEIYRSCQGEGLLTGTPSVFVRTSGCNLRCGFCDTPFASWEPDGQPKTVNQIVKQVVEISEQAQHIVITGGEPFLSRELNDLCRELRRSGFHITIETAGTIFREPECDLMSISPKFSNSDPDLERAGEWREKHQNTRYRPDIVRQLIQRYDYQLKFVVDAPDDMDEIQDYLRTLETVESDRVLLMPQGVEPNSLESKGEWLVSICQQHGFTFCPRKHIEWYGNRRGT